uniref:Ig-like domain-containing protein n=1 Tax=Iconisemion striatum TaxID=60296 RepID=A0A1A7Y1Y2_9TELE
MFIQYPTHMRGISLLSFLILIQATSCSITFTGHVGQNVTLACRYDTQTNGGFTFCWGRGTVPWFKCSNTILSFKNGDVIFRKSPRYQLLGRVAEGELSLTIIDAQRADSGVYGCRVEVPGLYNDQKVNTHLVVEEEIPTTQTPNLIITEKSQSGTDERIFSAFLGIGNITRMAAILLLTIVISLLLIIRRRALLRRKQRVDTFATENIYESNLTTK